MNERSYPWEPRPTSLMTDHYELTMLQASLRAGTASRRSVFEVFTRRLPHGRRYGVFAGVGRVLEGLETFHFSEPQLRFLRDTKVVDRTTINYLENFRFTGHIRGYAEGEVYFPHSPLLTVESSFAEACVLETYVLSVLNYDSAVASAASRMVGAAGDRPCIEMGSRRAHEEAAVAAARAAVIAGFASTSNMEAGYRYGVKTVGTAAHSFTLLHDSEEEAFRAQIAALGISTTLLVDTYDVENAVRLAVDIAGPDLGGVRLDSGDLVTQAAQVRSLLDKVGNANTTITVTSDLDEYAIAALRAAPVDSYGVGTRLVTGSGAPTSSMVYKLVAREGASGVMEPVAKASSGKASVGGEKFALRRRDDQGVATQEIVGVSHEPTDDGDDRELLVEYVTGGELRDGYVGAPAVGRARERHALSVAELPRAARRLSEGEPVIPTIIEPGTAH
ncbi:MULTISPECIES: nicotinate phosphoribosyltransferase [unclassified Candidatus Sulfotelmatobacter]|uniref:nicotinate phosphoribosyltransferase n=1 Tax=unclassified Candidatus Sulfotelmatobacter TaxID=2635724 RepID=UPI0028047960|nr:MULTISPECIES: nicotinate phosphoribosyltransferase [unclassified Candidatus Sulfotelmatobacter]